MVESRAMLRLLFIGDVYGKPGRLLLAKHLSSVRSQFDVVVANAENVAGGYGINSESFKFLLKSGVDYITLGNHSWDNREVFGFIDELQLLRPLNYPSGTPGRGFATLEFNNERLTVVNLMGRALMQPLDCPFHAIETLLEQPNLGAVFIDFHAEATAEKIALAWHFDGRVSAVVGTHTHVPTADTRILPKGTAFQTDVGMTGPIHSVIGMDPIGPIERFRSQMPHRFTVASGPCELNAVELDIVGGKVTRIARHRMTDELGV
jgi:2',3'-cyclic-nucleotide 2'-phosphodiesterase / phosphoenolpyruvate phosphatase